MKKITHAILRTLVYSDLFDYPLTAQEIHRNLIRFSTSEDKVLKVLDDCVKKKKIQKDEEFYFLLGRNSLVKKRQKRAIISRAKYEKALPWVSWLKFNPWLQMVAITGALSVDNAEEGDDIDLMLVFNKNRLFLGRFVEYIILKLFGKRRKPGQQEVSDLLCPNLYITEDNLLIKDQNLYTAHEITQVRLVWEKKPIYSLFIEQNKWIQQHLPNWRIEQQGQDIQMQKYSLVSLRTSKDIKSREGFILFDWLEVIAKKIQLAYMKKKVSIEKISDEALFFHPNDTKSQVLTAYQKKISELDLE